MDSIISSGSSPDRDEHDIEILLCKYHDHVNARRCYGEHYARQMCLRVRRVVTLLAITHPSQLTREAVAHSLRNMTCADRTRVEYALAMKNFARWLFTTNVLRNDPLAFLEPRQPARVIKSRPLQVEEIARLMNYLETVAPNTDEQKRFGRRERQLLYQTALKTGIRQGELRDLKKCDLRLDQQPPLISLNRRQSKRRSATQVPICDDLAKGLKEHVRDLHHDDYVFLMPENRVAQMFRADLKGASIEWERDSGEVVNFRSLRLTAIVSGDATP